MQASKLELPAKGFTKSEREWLKQLIEAIKTVQPLKGTNTSVDVRDGQGTVINVSQ